MVIAADHSPIDVPRLLLQLPFGPLDVRGRVHVDPPPVESHGFDGLACRNKQIDGVARLVLPAIRPGNTR